MPSITVLTAGVHKLLCKLKVNKASGPDGLSPHILKLFADELAPMLTCIFNQSLLRGSVPGDWRTAFVAPIFKKGKRTLASNYRPVSLTCICSKLMEHIICSNLNRHLERYNILSDRQHGFRAKRSCESQLLLLHKDLIEAKLSPQTKQVDMIVLDFSKAFDKVSHSKLLAKLEAIGVRNQTLIWISAFLTNRSQRVVLDGHLSSESPVLSGVPQGSVLGPVLFLVYINDLIHNLSPSTECRLFADDCLLYRTIKSESDAEILQGDLNLLQEWEKNWAMEFNPSKCQVLTLTKSRSRVPSEYFIHGILLENVPFSKYLGITFSNNLSWNRHIDIITAKAHRQIGLVRRNLNFCSRTTKERAYFALVRPCVEYASSLWDPGTSRNIKKIEMVQRSGLRFVHGTFVREEGVVSGLMEESKWLSLQSRRKLSRMCYIYKLWKGDVVGGLENFFKPKTNSRTRANNNFQFYKPTVKSELHKQCFYIRSIDDWNSLEQNIIDAPSLTIFRDRVHHTYRVAEHPLWKPVSQSK